MPIAPSFFQNLSPQAHPVRQNLSTADAHLNPHLPTVKSCSSCASCFLVNGSIKTIVACRWFVVEIKANKQKHQEMLGNVNTTSLEPKAILPLTESRLDPQPKSHRPLESLEASRKLLKLGQSVREPPEPLKKLWETPGRSRGNDSIRASADF